MIATIESPAFESPSASVPRLRFISVKCGSYNKAPGPIHCSNEVAFGALGASALKGRFLNDSPEEDGLTLYGFCKDGHKVAITHIDGVPCILNKDIARIMADGATDLTGLNQFISCIDEIDW